MESFDSTEQQSTQIRQPRPLKMWETWRSSKIEKRITLLAFFLTIVWPVYLTISLGPINVTPARLMAALALLSLICFSITFEYRMVQIIRVIRFSKSIYFWFTAYFIWRIICDGIGVDPASSYTLTMMDLICSGVFIFTITSISMNSLNSIPRAIVWVDFILISLGMIEFVFHFSLAPILSKFSSMSAEQLVVYGSDVYRGDVFRVRSLSSHPILLGSFAAGCIPILIQQFKSQESKLTFKIICLITGAMSPVVIIATDARSSFFGGIAGIVFYYFMKAIRSAKRDPALLVFLAIAAVMGLSAAATLSATSDAFGGIAELVAGRNQREQSSSEARMTMLDNGLKALSARPIAGYGDGQASKVAGLVGAQNVLTIDSYYLSVCLNFGYIGFTINIFFFISVLMKGASASIRSRVPPSDRDIISAMLATSICLLICAITVSSSEYFPLIYAMGACSATALARPIFKPSRSASREERLFPSGS